MPLVLYGLHFSPGVAEYQEPGAKAYRILINEDVAKSMDPTFAGKPIYVEHVEEVELDTIQEDADGWILESFFNKLDGYHWAKMILVSDCAQDAYRSGYKLSNAYIPKSLSTGGQWHGVSYQKEVRSGEYEHMALVRDPRYAESRILTPEEFKAYNEQKEANLKKLSNNKEEKTPMKFSFFQRTKVQNAKDVDLENLEVSLPKSKKIVTVAECIEGFDAVQNMSGYAANEHMVKYNDKEECSVGELVEKHNNLEKELTAMKEKNAGGEGEDAEMESMDNGDGVGVEEDDEDLGVEAGADKTKKNAAPKKKTVQNQEDSDEDEGEPAAKKKVNRNPAHFTRLKNAETEAVYEEPPTVMLSSDKVAKGRELYGSGA